MLLLLGYLLITVGFACGRPPFLVDDYVVTVHKGVLKSVQETSKSNGTLDLSGWGLVGIERTAFDGLRGLKSLNLDYNNLKSLPELVFVQLENLESLSMVGSTPLFMRNVFVGLSKLKSLNIDGDPRINWSWAMYHGLNPNIVKIKTTVRPPFFIMPEEFNGKEWIPVCIDNGIVKWVQSVENLESLRTVAKNCSSQFRLAYVTGGIHLDRMDIEGFEKGWYRFPSLSRDKIYLFIRNNKIKHITSTMFNDLGDNIKKIEFQRNPIKRIEKGVIKNMNLVAFNFDLCPISEIEDGAFADTGIRELYLRGNELKNRDFVATLPSSITKLDIQENFI